MDYESYDGCFDVVKGAASLTIFVDGTKKTYRNAMDRVGFEPTTTYVSSATMHARQVFYQTKLSAP
jgi:hypothetical protein